MAKENLLNMYKKMVLIRAFEERVAELYASNRIPGFLHLYVGEEAIAVGTCANLENNDWIVSTHRGHGHCLAKGGDPKYMIAELFGKKTGYCKGKGGSMHISNFEVGILCATGIVGSGLPLATGCGLSAKLRRTSQVAVCFFGDGAANQGTFHESLNLAAIYQLPVIFVCENNFWGQGGPLWEVCAVQDLSIRATGYGMPGFRIDGNDVMAVYETVGKAVKQARNGKGPTLIVCDTYRWRTHAEGVPIRRWYGKLKGEAWGSNEELEAWKNKDPIKRFKTRLIEMEIVTEKDTIKIGQEVKKIIDEAVKFAEDSPLPAPDETLEDVYV